METLELIILGIMIALITYIIGMTYFDIIAPPPPHKQQIDVKILPTTRLTSSTLFHQ